MTWVYLALFTAIVALTGGASRYDALQIVPLRGLSALFLIPALYFLTLRDLAAERILVAIFACFTLLVSAQLVPLPAAIWHVLPGRGGIAALDALLGLGDVWRPLSFAPLRTWNALTSLIVPATALLLAIALRASPVALLRMIAVLGLVNAVVGLMQVVTGRAGPFYFYEITNRGAPVGIFANENHAAIFAACSLLVVTSLGLRARLRGQATWERIVYPAAFVLILLTCLVGGSRAGFAASLGAVTVSIVMLFLASQARHARGSQRLRRRVLDLQSVLILALPAILVALIAAAFVLLDRTPAFRDLFAGRNLDDLRWSLWPILKDMMGVHWLFGAGFGSFEQVFHIYEPAELLKPQYINQAHNDWAQFVIEGGGGAILCLAGLLAWIGKAVFTLALQSATRTTAIFWVSIFSITGVASMVDYPLRTPLFQIVLVWLLLALGRDVRETKVKTST